MKKKLLLTIVLFSTILGAQNQKATLYFRDGTKLKGLAKLIRGGTEVKYRKDKKSKVIVYNSQKIDKITIRQSDIDVPYQYKIIKKKSHPTLLEILKIGKVTLYRTVNINYYGEFYPYGAAGPRTGGGYSRTVIYYYASKNNSDFVTRLGKRGSLLSKNFRKSIIKYFNDCPELVAKIKSKEFRKRDIVEIVEFYNTNCQ